MRWCGRQFRLLPMVVVEEAAAEVAVDRPEAEVSICVLPTIVRVEFYGFVKIYNPVNHTLLGKKPPTPAQPADQDPMTKTVRKRQNKKMASQVKPTNSGTGGG